MNSISKKHIPLSIFIIIFIVIIAIGIGISVFSTKKPATIESGTPTTTITGIPYQLKESNTNTTGQYTISSGQPSQQNDSPTPPPAPQPQTTISILYPTNNATLINDPAYQTPLATILWKSKSTNSKNVTLDLQDQNGSIVKNIVTNAANTGTFVWLSDSTISNGRYRIRVHTTTNGLPTEDMSDTFAITSPSASQHPNSVWQTYINPQYGFSFTYPNDFSFASINAQYPGTNILKIEPRLNYYIHANDIETVDASNIIIAAKPTTEASCPSSTETTGAQGYVYGNMDTIQGTYTRFSKIKRNDFGINNQYSRYVDYFTFYKGMCYSFKFTAHVIRLPFSTNALYQAPDKLENDISRLLANVEQMILSFGFSQ